ncbi:MAG: signal peptidase I [Proteobacteria bacterium]|nr:signal peptidase I [Desulfocapsa sp.]MBU3945512.1 signal peptidase I [Pseudomonadota bacterium]MCG2745098.1 signal peptidase I [Desulfobacteraceae bacterium]MBU3982674.1 signal peptidase I [Pseudomonadota bacterium]MBU4029223.1 signal peptidase I [Pseudomonadota bacterium]
MGKNKSVVREYVEAIVVAVLLALFVRTFIVQAFKIPSGSMLPTLQIGDHLLVSKFSYGVRVPVIGTSLISRQGPAHGDVVVFRFPRDRSLDYIKRVVAIGGDSIEVRDKQVFLNGQQVENPHAHFTSRDIMSSAAGPRDNFGPVTVPDGKIFVMGDNRDNSYDSRFWGFVDLQDVLGKALIIYWSWDVDKSLFSIDRYTSIRWDRLGDIVR